MSYNITMDMHTHTLVSGHAYGTIREMAQIAKQRNLSYLGFTEHGPLIPGTCDPLYFYNLKAAPKELFGVKIMYGSEVNVTNDGHVDLEPRYHLYLDYLIAGIHGVCYKDVGIVKNTENLISAMQSKLVYFISHPDDNRTPLDYEALVPASKEFGVALELNNSSLLKPEIRKGCVENCKTMLKLCAKHGAPIIVNTDAHDPEQVGDFTQAIEMLKELCFPEELIVNMEVDKFMKWIDKN